MAFGYVTECKKRRLSSFLAKRQIILNRVAKKGDWPLEDFWKFVTYPPYPTSPNGPGQNPILLKHQEYWMCSLCNDLVEPHSSRFVKAAHRSKEIEFWGKLGRRNVLLATHLKKHPDMLATKITYPHL